jgi:hypothetical protein
MTKDFKPCQLDDLVLNLKVRSKGVIFVTIDLDRIAEYFPHPAPSSQLPPFLSSFSYSNSATPFFVRPARSTATIVVRAANFGKM